MASADDIKSLTDSLEIWEYLAYLSIAAVAVGVAGEVIHDFTEWFKWVKWWKDKGEKYSAILLVIALFAELGIQIKENSISGMITADLERQTAALEKKNTELRIKAANLERMLGPRHINGDVFLSILGDGPKGEFEIRYASDDQETALFVLTLRVLLTRSGWRLIGERPVPTAELLRSVSGYPSNVIIEVKEIGAGETPILSPPNKNQQPRTLWTVLSGAIMSGAGIMTGIQGWRDESLPEDRVRITVFPRPGM